MGLTVQFQGQRVRFAIPLPKHVDNLAYSLRQLADVLESKKDMLGRPEEVSVVLEDHARHLTLQVDCHNPYALTRAEIERRQI